MLLNFQKVLVNLTGMKISWLREISWEFAWVFADNLVIKFGPFLVVVIIWLLYGKREKQSAHLAVFFTTTRYFHGKC
jgi:hypothetical protein